MKRKADPLALTDRGTVLVSLSNVRTFLQGLAAQYPSVRDHATMAHLNLILVLDRLRMEISQEEFERRVAGGTSP